MENFGYILNRIQEQLSKVHYENGDLSDIGNEIGIALGDYMTTDQDFTDFIHGLRHGVSLTKPEH